MSEAVYFKFKNISSTFSLIFFFSHILLFVLMIFHKY